MDLKDEFGRNAVLIEAVVVTLCVTLAAVQLSCAARYHRKTSVGQTGTAEQVEIELDAGWKEPVGSPPAR